MRIKRGRKKMAITETTECPACGGYGQIFFEEIGNCNLDQEPCNLCGGTGKVTNDSIKVNGREYALCGECDSYTLVGALDEDGNCPSCQW